MDSLAWRAPPRRSKIVSFRFLCSWPKAINLPDTPAAGVCQPWPSRASCRTPASAPRCVEQRGRSPPYCADHANLVGRGRWVPWLCSRSHVFTASIRACLRSAGMAPRRVPHGGYPQSWDGRSTTAGAGQVPRNRTRPALGPVGDGSRCSGSPAGCDAARDSAGRVLRSAGPIPHNCSRTPLAG
jgi:hypothetical protein